MLTCAVEVVLKERRPLVLMLRGTPLRARHLEQLLRLARLRAIIGPLVPACYIRPRSAHDVVDQAVGRVLDLLDVNADLPHRWPRGGDLIGLGAAGTPWANSHRDPALRVWRDGSNHLLERGWIRPRRGGPPHRPAARTHAGMCTR